MAGGLLVESGEEQVPGGIGVSMWPCKTSRCGGKQAVLRAGCVSEAPVSEEKVPGGVECCRGVGADVCRVVVVTQSGSSIAGSLGGERRLAGAKVVGAVVDFKSAHPVCEWIYPQSHFSFCYFAC